jgi:hypothetical protein
VVLCIFSSAGIENWPGKQSHSHNYRVPDSFSEQVSHFISGSLYLMNCMMSSVARVWCSSQFIKSANTVLDFNTFLTKETREIDLVDTMEAMRLRGIITSTTSFMLMNFETLVVSKGTFYQSDI